MALDYHLGMLCAEFGEIGYDSTVLSNFHVDWVRLIFYTNFLCTLGMINTRSNRDGTKSVRYTEI